MKGNNVNSLENCVSSICLFARRININNVKTPNQVFNETKYSQYQDEISEEKIINEIKLRTSIIEEWLIYSQNKRYTPAWYFLQKEENKYLVGYYGLDKTKSFEKEYFEPFSACAHMIKVEMEEFQRITSNGK